MKSNKIHRSTDYEVFLGLNLDEEVAGALGLNTKQVSPQTTQPKPPPEYTELVKEIMIMEQLVVEYDKIIE